MKRAIIIDDDPVFHKIIGSLISLHNITWQTTFYTNAVNALTDLIQISENNQPAYDIAILDLNMPFPDGRVFLDALYDTGVIPGSNLKVYIITSSIDPDDRQLLDIYPAVKGIYSKPVTAAVLQEIADGDKPGD